MFGAKTWLVVFVPLDPKKMLGGVEVRETPHQTQKTTSSWLRPLESILSDGFSETAATKLEAHY